jgi:hypothetical protein
MSAGALTVALVAAVVLYALVALARPTRACRRCNGERVSTRRLWLTGRSRMAPCRRCPATGHVPWLGARTIYRLIRSVKNERNKP